MGRHPLDRHPMDLMLNLCKGHAFVELNYPHIIDNEGMNGITLWRESVSLHVDLDVHQSCQTGTEPLG